MKIGKYLLVIAAALLFSCSSTENGGESEETIVCFGNSLTEGWGTNPNNPDNPVDKSKAYPHYLAEKVNVPVINLGVSGETTSDAVKRISEVLSHNPAVVFIEFGANDLIRQVEMSFFLGRDIDPNFVDKAEQNFKTIINNLANDKRQIYLVKFYNEAVAREMITENLGIEYMHIYDDYESMFSRLESKYRNRNFSLIENMWDGIWGNSELMYADDIYEIHPNAEGYKIMAGNIFNEAKEYLMSKGFAN